MTCNHASTAELRRQIDEATTLHEVETCIRAIAALCEELAEASKQTEEAEDKMEAIDIIEDVFFGTAEIQRLCQMVSSQAGELVRCLAYDVGRLSSELNQQNKERLAKLKEDEDED